jgi:hypothetical protein
MIRAVVVCPPAPFLIPGVADNLRRQVAELATACDRALADLAGSDRIFILVPAGRTGPRLTRRLAPGARLRGAAFGRSDCPVVPDLVLPGGRSAELDPPADLDLPADTFLPADRHPPPDLHPPAPPEAVVGGYLLHQAGIGAAIDVIEVAVGDAPAVADLIAGSTEEIGVLAMADGAAAHGPRAPMAEDARAVPTDRALAEALAIGDPSALAVATDDVELLRVLGVTGIEVYRVVAGLPAPTMATLTHYSAPFGVGYLVATWSYRPDPT